MGLHKFIAAKRVQALKCNQSFLQQQLGMYWNAEQNYVGKFTKQMPDLIGCLAGIKSQGKAGNELISLKILCDWKVGGCYKAFHSAGLI